MIVTVLVICLIFLLATGIEVGVAMALTGLVLLLTADGVPLVVVAQSALRSVDSYSLVAIPFFILTGNLMLRGELARMLLDLFGSFLRVIRGGLSLAFMAASVVMAAISGSSMASVLTMGPAAVKLMDDEGFDKKFTAGLIAVGGTLGLMIPPSLSFIVIGSMAEISIPALFLAGVFPGIIDAAACALLAIIICRLKGFGIKQERVDLREVGRKSVRSSGALVLPVLILGGIYGGFFTPTEVSALAALIAFLLVVLVYRTIRPRGLLPVFVETLHSASMVYLLIIGSQLLGSVMTRLGLARDISQMLIAMDLPPWGFLLMINLVFLILGCFMDAMSLTILMIPLLFPIVEALGINSIHFGVVMTMNAEVAMLTPPIGLNLLAMSGITDMPIHKVARGVIPFFIVELCILILITYVPAVSIFLPRLLRYG